MSLKFSICLPVYKGSKRLKEALDSIYSQNFKYIGEIIIIDDTPPDLYEERKAIKKIVLSFEDKKIKYYVNKKNLGSALNIRKLFSLASEEIVYFLCQDDVLAKDSLHKAFDIFNRNKHIGAITRPYYWFHDNIKQPIRAVYPLDCKNDKIISLKKSTRDEFITVLETLGQLSGLAFRKKMVNIPFGDECFTGHVYPFLGVLRDYQCIFLKDYSVAVRLSDSQARHVSSIYDLSPVASWITTFQRIFSEKRYKKFREWGIDHVTQNYIGLLQLKNYAKKGVLEREIKIMLKSRPQNIINIRFWFYSLISLIFPVDLLRVFTDKYKFIINRRFLPKIYFNY